MKKLLLLLLLSPFFANAQDIITTSSGEEIKATVTTVTDSTISYKKFGTETPLYTKNLKLIFQVKYQNGDIEKYNKEAVPLDNILEVSRNSPKDLLKKGNNVFIAVPNGNSLESCKYFFLNLRGWNYWNIVNSPDKAHFIIEFYMEPKTFDFANWIVFKTREKVEFLRSPIYRSSTTSLNGYNPYKAGANKVMNKFLKETFK